MRGSPDKSQVSPFAELGLGAHVLEAITEVGYAHRVRPGNIVGAIANVADLEGWQIGHVDIRDDHTFVGLPKKMPEAVMTELSNTLVAGRALRITAATEVVPKAARKTPPKGPRKPTRKPTRKPPKGPRPTSK